MGTFRVDIQAMRAISVLAVVFYHARWPGFSGGYCGVDIFFVISGFLITGQLLRERQETGRINIPAFWARRAWRLLPNALATLLVTIILTWVLIPADAHLSVGRDVLSALFYFANYRFANRAVDYFDESITSSPLLYFWSLSVEEQFYFVWPIFLLMLGWLWFRKDGPAVAVALILILIVSFVLSLFWMTYSQPHAFFGTDGRVWQLSVGALLAAQMHHFVGLSYRFKSMAVLVGFVGMASAIFLFDDHMAYPGWLAVFPVVAAGMVIGGGVGTRASGGAFLNSHRCSGLVCVPTVFISGTGLFYCFFHWHFRACRE